MPRRKTHEHDALFGSRLRKLMDERGLSLRDLSRLTAENGEKLHESSISRLITGQRRASHGVVRDLAKALKISPEYLAWGEARFEWVTRNKDLLSSEQEGLVYDLYVSGCDPNPVGTVYREWDEIVVFVRGNSEANIGPLKVDTKPSLEEAQHSLERRFGLT